MRRRLADAGSVRLTGRGTGFLVTAGVTFVAAPVLSLPALQYVTALLAGLVVLGALFVVVGHARVGVERSFDPDVVTPDRPARVRLRVTNLRTLPCLQASWRDTLPRALTGDAKGRLPALGAAHGPDARTEVAYTVHGLRRGRHAVGPLTVEVGDPFGLVARRREVGGTTDVVVLPRRTEVTGEGRLVRDHDGSGGPAPQHAGVGSDDVIARPYLAGDALKRVHWKATAHHGELMVRQEEQQTDPGVGIVLDPDDVAFATVQDARGAWDHSPELEWAVGAAASLLTHLARQGHEVTVRTLGGEPLRVGERAASVDDVLVDLALLEPATSRAVTRDAARTGERHLVLLLGRVGTDRAAAWTRALSGTSVLALVARGTSTETIDLLEAAGWRVAGYGSGDDLDERWAALGGRMHRAAT